MKRIIALALALIMVLSLFSFASADGEKVKLKGVFIAHPLTRSVTEMKWVQECADAAGVEIEWEQIYTDWEQLKTTRFAAGDIPDVLFNATSDSDYTTYSGLFLELTPYISEEKTPNICAMFAEEPDTLSLAKTLEGEIYGLPKFQGKWPDCNGVLFINKVWLDAVGMAVPTTLSELKAVLEAFKANDANGNGDPNDEVPMDFNGWFGGAYSLSNFIGDWGIQLVNWGTDAYFAEDGVIKNYAVDVRYKAMMKYLADLYAEGLINENAITNDYSMFQSLSRGDANGNALVGVVYGWEQTDKFGPYLHEQYIPFGPLTDDVDDLATSTPRVTYDFSGLNMSSNRVAVSAKCANPEAAIAFLDQFYSQTHSVEGLFGGIADGNIAQVGDNEYTVLPPPEGTDAGTWKWTSTFADNAPMYIRRATVINMAQDMTYAIEEREQYKAAVASIDMDKEYYPQMFMRYSTDDQNTLAQLQAGITSITDSWWGIWLTGEADIEDTWEDYVAEVEGAGLAEVLAIRQAAYDAYKAQ